MMKRTASTKRGSKRNSLMPLRRFLLKNALFRNQNKFLTKMNDEGKVRRLTKSTILGRAKVMTYEDLEDARVEDDKKKAKRAEKEARKEARKALTANGVATDEATVEKCGRKRKNSASAVPEPKAKVAWIGKALAAEGELKTAAPERKVKVVRRREAQAIENKPGASASELQARKPRVKKVKIVPEPWRAPVARMF